MVTLSCFQKIKTTILASSNGVAVFLDDTIVYTPDKKTCNRHLQSVTQALMEIKLILNEEKCCIASVIDFVGFCLSVKGVIPLHLISVAIHRTP